MITINANEYSVLPIGKRGEDRGREVVFDLRGWKEDFGEGQVLLLARRAGESTSYPCGVTVRDGFATWTVRAADVEIPGMGGSVELIYYVDGRIVKSETWATFVVPDLGGVGLEPPPPAKDWVEAVMEEVQKIQVGISEIEVGKVYVHIQGTPTELWTIQHNLGKRCPNIVCLNESGDRIFGDVEYFSDNLTRITFSTALTGTAHLS